MSTPVHHTLDDRTTTVGDEEVGRRFDIEVSTLANWRWLGKGPPYVKVGGRVRYRLSDLADWLDSQTRTSTSDGGSDATEAVGRGSKVVAAPRSSS